MFLSSHLRDRITRKLLTTALGPDHLRSDGVCRLSPAWIMVGINNVCNLHCKMCDVGVANKGTSYWDNLVGEHPQNMTVDLYRELLSQAADFFPRPRIGIAYTEPLIHPRVLDICRLTKEAGFYLSITSNGTNLPRTAEALVDIGVDHLNISVDGPEHIHNDIRGTSHSFHRIHEGIERLNNARRRLRKASPRLELWFTITNFNYRHILDFVKSVELLHPHRITISHLSFISEELASQHNARYGNAYPVSRSNLGETQLERLDAHVLADELDRVKRYLRGRLSAPELRLRPPISDAPALDLYYHSPSTFVSGRQCHDSFNTLMIKTDGTVIPSHGRCYNHRLGDIHETRLRDIWNNTRATEFRRTLQRSGGSLTACARCPGVLG